MKEVNLFEYRKANGLVAKWRDDGLCGICGRVADESDHVFGRGSKRNLLLEHWMLRMSLCKDCHHQKHHGHSFDRVAQVMKLKATNERFSAVSVYDSVRLDIGDLMFAQEDEAKFLVDKWIEKNG